MSMRKIAAELEKKQLLDMYRILDTLCGDKKETVSNEKILQAVHQKEEELLEEINLIQQREKAMLGGEYDITLFEDDILCGDEKIILRKPAAEDKDPYFLLKKANTYFQATYCKPGYKEELWQEYISRESLYYTIAAKENSAFIGYCGVKDLNWKVWEIAIELKAEYCGQGYGYRALKMYLEKTASLSGRHEFSSRVDADNIASQKLMEKTGFRPYGLSEFLLHKEEDQLAAEEKYLDEIDDRYQKLAEKFHVEPRKLLSHILEYRIAV